MDDKGQLDEEIKESLTWVRCLECDGLCGYLPSAPICPNCGAEVPDYLFVESEPWPDFPEIDSLLGEEREMEEKDETQLDYRELYERAEMDRSFWFALAKELAAVLVTETWEEWGDEHGELLSLPLSPVSPAAILAYYQEGVKREGVDE